MPDGFINISFTVTGAEPVVAKLATWGREVGDLTPAWEQVGDAVLADMQVNMATEGGLYAGGWQPLKPSTIASRLRDGYAPGPILWRSGYLGDSFVRGGQGNVFEASHDSVIVGTEIPYARYHQYGTSRMPARKIVGLTWQMRAKVVQILGDFVRAAARGAGLNPTEGL